MRTSNASALGLVVWLAACSAAPEALPDRPLRVPGERGVLILYGDSRPRLPLEVWRRDVPEARRQVIDALAAEAPDAIVNSGDLVARGSKSEDWERFASEHAPILGRGIPFYPAIGNHEYWPEDGPAMAHFAARFPALGGRRFYALDWRDVRLLVTNSNFANLSDGEAAAQRRWLERQLDAAARDAGVRAIIVVTHHPPYTNAIVHGDDARAQAEIVTPALRCPKVVAFVSGHTHTYERLRRHGVTFVVSGGGGAPLMSVLEPGRHRDAYGGRRGFHYCRLVHGSPLRVEVVMLGDQERWAVVDRFDLVRDEPMAVHFDGFLATRGGRVYARCTGQGPDLVLLHGLADCSAGWRKVEAPLRRKGCRVTVWDALGAGAAEKPVDARYGIDAHAERLREVLDRLGIERATLVGNSLGGSVALLFASLWPQRVERLVLLSPAAYPQGGWLPEGVWQQGGLGQAALGVLPAAAIVEAALRMNFGDPARITAGDRQTYALELGRRDTRQGFVAQQRDLMPSPEQAARWHAGFAALRLPVLVLWGTRDRVLAPALGERLARDLPQARLVRLEGVGHVAQLEDPERVVREILGFLAARDER